MSRNWKYISSVTLSVVNATAVGWLHLANASLALHTMIVNMNGVDRDDTRYLLVKKISGSYRECRSMLRMTPNAFELLCSMISASASRRDYKKSSTEEQVIVFLFIGES